MDVLAAESKRVAERLEFLSTVASLWKCSSVSPALAALIERGPSPSDRSPPATALRRWIDQAENNRAALTELLTAVRQYRVPVPSADHDALVEYDRRRMTKESLLERCIATSVEMAGAARLLAATLGVIGSSPAAADSEQGQIVALLSELLKRDPAATRALCPELRTLLAIQPLL